ncbi:MAG: hypothetical protein IPJ90_14200 [Anaerolineaceae bacterium]|nr:hypothetical protein [Anaerolineaceae bacterium]
MMVRIALGQRQTARPFLMPKMGRGNGKAQVNENAWLPLLDQAVVEAGQRGIHSLVAEVDEVSDELPVLRRAGFVVYTRQDVWVLAPGTMSETENGNKSFKTPPGGG